MARAEVKVFSFPDIPTVHFSGKNEPFVSGLENLAESYEFLEQGGLKSLCIGLIYDKLLNVKNPFVYENGIQFISHRYPRNSISQEQDVTHSLFRASLDSLLKAHVPLHLYGIKSLHVILFFNQDIEKVKIAGLEEEKNEEGLAFFTAVEPRYRLEQIVLNESLLLEIQKSLLILSKICLIYHDWGFSEIDPEPRAVLNFFGPSGTGKTMTAHAVAHNLSSKILALNYAEIESKFVGDAPKNLVRAFETASRERAVLFFDEADSFLGKRISNVSTSSDQAVNSLRSQMLILLESFDGIVIFATNLVTNYDRAFESRIFKHLKFELPDFEARSKIIKKTVQPRVPLENDSGLPAEIIADLAKVSDGFSGREIKNAVLDSLVNALSDNREVVKASDFKSAFSKQQKSKTDLAKETGKSANLDISQAKKGLLEKKIQNNLKTLFHEIIVKIAVHAAFADGSLDMDEKVAIEKMAKAFDVSFMVPDSPDKIDSVDELLIKIDSKEKTAEVIEVISHVIAANKIYTDEEREFVTNICSQLNLGSETVEKVNEHILTMTEAYGSLTDLKKFLVE